MNALPRLEPTASAGFGAVIDDVLAPSRVRSAAHPEDWPLSPDEPDLPRQIWDHALGDLARDILGRPSRQFRARLCALAWRLGDGVGPVPARLPALIEIVHAGSLIVDDIEDGSRERRGGPCLHLVHGLPRALNAGNWMYFSAMDLVEQLDATEPTRARLRRALVDGMHRCHLGQAIDLSVPVGDIPQAWVYRTVATSTMLKTGALTELAARLGAIAAEAPPARIEALARFGRRLGLGLQMLDDFGNLAAPSSETTGSKALEDLRNGRPTWPWAHAAEELDEPAFLDLQHDVRALGRGPDGDGTRARALAAKLRMAVGLKGRLEASGYLRRSLGDLHDAVGARGELALLAAEIEKLEAAYA